MKLSYGLTIEQTQKLTMTPELIQAIQILQFNTQELDEFVQEELMQNPVLEFDKAYEDKSRDEVSKSEELDVKACEQADIDGIVINTSYSDAVIPWLQTAGEAAPDFGSGNLNHLIPRMKFAVANILGVDDFWNVDFKRVSVCINFRKN